MFKFKAFGETIEISPFWVVPTSHCPAIGQFLEAGWSDIRLDEIRARLDAGCGMIISWAQV
jgi:hypothetical protein